MLLQSTGLILLQTWYLIAKSSDVPTENSPIWCYNQGTPKNSLGTGTLHFAIRHDANFLCAYHRFTWAAASNFTAASRRNFDRGPHGHLGSHGTSRHCCCCCLSCCMTTMSVRTRTRIRICMLGPMPRNLHVLLKKILNKTLLFFQSAYFQEQFFVVLFEIQ